MANQESIKSECNAIYEQLKSLNDRLSEIRTKECKHPNVSEKLYSWRIGSQLPADICDDCGHLVKMKMGEIRPTESQA